MECGTTMSILKRLASIFCLTLCASFLQATAATSPEARTARYFESIRNQPPLLLSFLRQMPKGGDLHNHLSGTIYAESFIQYAAHDGLCVNRATDALSSGSCDACGPEAAKPAAACALHDPGLYNSLVDAWSMRNWRRGDESGHDRFFATFDKFGPASHNHTGEMLAEARAHAASDHLQYLELLETADGGEAAPLGKRVGWDDDLPRFRQKLIAANIDKAVSAGRRELDEQERTANHLLQCDTPQAQPGCNVQVRFVYQVLRGLAKEQVFAQMFTGFLLAKADPRVVSLNLVMPEDWYVPMHDFGLHMKMMAYLHSVYPDVPITLHAGELTIGLVPPEGLRHHIRDSITLGHAERIGHGVDLMNEDNPEEILKTMAQRHILVEVCLTSNDVILGVSGPNHPLSVYEANHVPVALATDDAGVARSDMTHEFLRAAMDQQQTYTQLKTMARNSLEHAFLPGASLWSDARSFQRTKQCANDRASSKKPSRECEAFLTSSERATQQWKLEQSFAAFELRY